MSKYEAVKEAQDRADELGRTMVAYNLGENGLYVGGWTYGSESWYEGMKPCDHVVCRPRQ